MALRSYEEFILRDQAGQFFAVPVVPLGRDWLTPAVFEFDRTKLRRDEPLEGKIKVLPRSGANGSEPSVGLRWVSLPEHTELVRWWNEAPAPRP